MEIYEILLLIEIILRYLEGIEVKDYEINLVLAEIQDFIYGHIKIIYLTKVVATLIIIRILFITRVTCNS